VQANQATSYCYTTPLRVSRNNPAARV